MAIVFLKKQTTAPSTQSTAATIGPAISEASNLLTSSFCVSVIPMVAEAAVVKSRTAPPTKHAVATILKMKLFPPINPNTPPTTGNRKERKIRKLKFRIVIELAKTDSLYPNASCEPVYEYRFLVVFNAVAEYCTAGRNIIQNAAIPNTNAIAPGMYVFKLDFFFPTIKPPEKII